MKKNFEGFTLVELIIVVALIGIVFSVAYSIFFTGQKSFEVGIDKGTQQSDNRILREYLTNEFKNTSYLSNSKLDETIFTKNIYYTLKSEKENGKFVLKKTKFIDNVPELPFTIPIKMDKVELKSEGQIIKVKFTPSKIKKSVEINREYDFTIFLENNPKLNNITLNESENIIYYTYPEDTKRFSENSDSNSQGNVTIPPDKFDGVNKWDDTGKTKYYKGDKVKYGEGLFVSIHVGQNTWIPGTVHSTWQEITNEWRSFNTYNIGDEVLYIDNILYVCKVNNTIGHSPEVTSNWKTK